MTDAAPRSYEDLKRFWIDTVSVSTLRSETAPKSLNTYKPESSAPALMLRRTCGRITRAKTAGLERPSERATSIKPESILWNEIETARIM